MIKLKFRLITGHSQPYLWALLYSVTFFSFLFITTKKVYCNISSTVMRKLLTWKMMTISALHNEVKPLKVTAEKAGCSQSAEWKHIDGKLGKVLQETVMSRQVYSRTVELHKGWSRSIKSRHTDVFRTGSTPVTFQILLSLRPHQECLGLAWGEKDLDCPLFIEVKFALNLEIKIWS